MAKSQSLDDLIKNLRTAADKVEELKTTKSGEEAKKDVENLLSCCGTCIKVSPPPPCSRTCIEASPLL